MKSTNKRIKLDSTKLTGFKQAKSSRGKPDIKSMAGGKTLIGIKPV
jgi:hypothetical protein